MNRQTCRPPTARRLLSVTVPVAVPATPQKHRAMVPEYGNLTLKER